MGIRDKRGNGFLVTQIGVLLIIAGFAAMFITFTGVIERVLHLELLPAMQKYIIGTIIAIILVMIGIFILYFS